MDEILSVLLGVAAILAVPVFAIAGFVQARRARAEIATLKAEFALLRQSLAAGIVPPAAAPDLAPEAAPSPESVIEPSPSVTTEPPPDGTSPEPGGAEDVPAPLPEPVAARASLEETLTSRWLVWLGGVALALGGGFLVKYSIDAGLLSPAVRILLGFLLAAALLAVGEWLRRRSPAATGPTDRPDYVPAAVSAAGVCIAFATVYAAYALYALIGAAPTFIALGAVAFGAIALSLVQGPLVAALGVAGGYVAPLLVSSAQPVAWPLFTYLFFVAAAGVGVVRYRGWWWLGWLSLAGAALWPVLWAMTAWSAADGGVIGAYLVLLAALFLLVRYDGPTEAALPLPSEAIALAAAAAIAALTLMLVRMDAYGPASLIAMTALLALYFVAGRRDEALGPVAPIAALLVVLALAAWHVPQFVPDPEARLPVLPPEAWSFATACLLYGGALAAAGFAALWGARRPGLWAAVSAGGPTAILVVAYWRLTGFAVEPSWTIIGLAVAAAFLVAAQRVARYRTPYLDEALAAYAVGIAACVAFAATATLREVWLTVALSLELPAIGWIYTRLRVPSLRWIAAAVAIAVLARLVLNIEIIEYRLAGSVPGLNWLLYGYGVPAACFYAASRLFRDLRDDPLTMLLEAGALVFGVLLVSLEIRALLWGDIDAPGYPLVEQSLQSIAWASIAYGLLRADAISGNPVARWGWRVLACLAAAQILLLQCLWDNPLWSGDPVGRLPIVNILLLAYGIPGAIAVAFADTAHRQGRDRLAMLAGALAMVLILLWLSLEVRRAFQGPVLAGGETSGAEWYTYSAAWLVYAAALLFVGIWRTVPVLRYASLGIVLLTVVKVFLFDMSALEGIYRVLSFLGLGAALVATGFFYQRLVFPSARTAPS